MPQAVVVGFGTEVIGQRAVREPELLASGHGLLRVPHHLQLLVVRDLQRRQPGGNSIVGARLDLHVVRRIGVDQGIAVPSTVVRFDHMINLVRLARAIREPVCSCSQRLGPFEVALVFGQGFSLLLMMGYNWYNPQ